MSFPAAMPICAIERFLKASTLLNARVGHAREHDDLISFCARCRQWNIFAAGGQLLGGVHLRQVAFPLFDRTVPNGLGSFLDGRGCY
jgi:hypothetical protein